MGKRARMVCFLEGWKGVSKGVKGTTYAYAQTAERWLFALEGNALPTWEKEVAILFHFSQVFAV